MVQVRLTDAFRVSPSSLGLETDRKVAFCVLRPHAQSCSGPSSRLKEMIRRPPARSRLRMLRSRLLRPIPASTSAGDRRAMCHPLRLATMSLAPIEILHVLAAVSALLLAAHLGGLLAANIGIPPMIGELTGGVLLGATVFRRVWPRGH